MIDISPFLYYCQNNKPTRQTFYQKYGEKSEMNLITAAPNKEETFSVFVKNNRGSDRITVNRLVHKMNN